MANFRWRTELSELPRLALALGTLALVGFSLVLSCQMGALSSASQADFAERNTLGEHGRWVLLASLAAGLAAPLLVGLLLISRKGLDAALRQLERSATLSSPLALLFFVPALFLSNVATGKPLYYLVALAGFGLASNALLTNALTLLEKSPPGPIRQRLSALAGPMRGSRWVVPRGLAATFVLLVAAGYALCLGHSAVVHHRLIQTVTSDLGIADNAMANLLHGRWFRAPAQFGTAVGNYSTLHAEYGALLFLPIYALHPGSETLLWLQAALAALAALPLYFLATRSLGRKVGVWLAIAYLLVAPIHCALLTGFSWIPAVALFVFTLCLAVESKRTGLALIALAGLLAISESGPLYAIGLGIMLLATRKSARWGFAIALLALPVTAFNLYWSLHGPGAIANPPLASALRTLWSEPVYFFWDLARAAKLSAMLHALAPLLLLPLLDVACWSLLLPGVLFVSAASVFWPNAGGSAAASVVWVPGCFLALLVVLEKKRNAPWGRSSLAAALIALTVTQLSHSSAFGALLGSDAFCGIPPNLFRMSPEGKARYANLKGVLALIPATVSVGATTYLLPHVSNRRDAFDLTRPYGRPEYILVSSRETANVRSALQQTFAHDEYRLAAHREEFYLFARGTSSPETARALAGLGLARTND